MMRVFTKVAQRSSFVAAARELRISRASVTKYVAAVEARVGARLLDRTTRSVRMTEAGRIYFDRCQECLQALQNDRLSALRAWFTSSAPGRGQLWPLVAVVRLTDEARGLR